MYERIVGSQWFVSLASCGIRGLWLYQALLDTVRVLESVLGVVAYDKFGDPHGTGKGQVVLWWGTHKHLFSKHWGELIDIDSVWKDLDGDMPELIYSNPQFALSDDKEQRHGQGHSASRWRQSTSRWWQKPCVAQRW